MQNVHDLYVVAAESADPDHDYEVTDKWIHRNERLHGNTIASIENYLSLLDSNEVLNPYILTLEAFGSASCSPALKIELRARAVNDEVLVSMFK